MRRYLGVLLLFLLGYTAAIGQVVPLPAQKQYLKAQSYLARKDYKAYTTALEKALELYPAYVAVYSELGQWYYQQNQAAQAITIFQKAMEHCGQQARHFALPLSKSYIAAYRYKDAQALMSAYAMPRDSAWAGMQKQVSFLKLQMEDYARRKDTLIHLNRVNTAFPETFPSVSQDGKTLFFTRRLNNVDDDFYYAHADSFCGGWLAGSNAGKVVNTMFQEAASMISYDGHYLFFTRCENRSVDGFAQGGCDLYMAFRKSEETPWSAAESFGFTINTPGYEGMPCLTADNHELYFVSNREGGYGGMDIWYSRFENGLWQAPRNLGPQINTAGDELSPFIAADKHTLYFASKGHAGFGGSDFYVSHRINDTTWSAPQNLGYPINSSADELGIALDNEGTQVYFASDRDSLIGNYDLYACSLPEEFLPRKNVFIKGYIYDSLSKDRLNYANIFIQNTENSAENYTYKSNRGDGSYLLILQPGQKYSVAVSRISYQTYSEELDLSQVTGRDTAFSMALLPYSYTRPVTDSTLLTVGFKKNILQVGDELVRQELKNIAEHWKNNKNVVQILVNGYTDNSGSPLINEEFSTKRAQHIAGLIEQYGFDGSRVFYKGWGETNPLTDNSTEENKDINRRVEIVIRIYE